MREKERERGREREGARERERERARARETEYYVAFGRRIVDEEAKIRPKKFAPTIFPFVDSGPITLSQEICGASSLVSIMGEGERGRETERVPCRIILFTMR